MPRVFQLTQTKSFQLTQTNLAQGEKQGKMSHLGFQLTQTKSYS